MAREELKWQNIDADDLPAAVKKSFDAMVEAESTFKADLEKLLKDEGHMPEDKFLVMSRKGKRLGVAFASTPRGEGGAGSPPARSPVAFRSGMDGTSDVLVVAGPKAGCRGTVRNEWVHK